MQHNSQPGRWRSGRRPTPVILWSLVVLVLFVFVRHSVGQEQRASKYQVKAAYLYNFAKFVEWPADAFPSPDASLRICVLGRDPFGHDDLEQLVAGKTVNGRRLQIVHLRDLQQAKACQILFVASPEKQQVRQALQALAGARVLTVGDSEGFVQLGGIINFVLDQDRVRFEINLQAAEQARLRLSARLLTVAKQVIGGRQPGDN